MNQRELEKAISAEVERWPGVSVQFVPGGKHPKAKFTFEGLIATRPYASTPSDGAFAVHNCLGDMRRIMKQLGAVRDKPEPSKEEDEAPYRKANEGKAQRPDPVASEHGKVKPTVGERLVEAGVTATDKIGAAAEAVFGVGADLIDKAEATAERVREARQAAEPASPADRHRIQAERGLESYAKLALLEGFDEPDHSGEDTEEREARLAALLAEVLAIEDGIYFGLRDAVYHAVPRLSASGLQRLCVSPATFWRGSWLDPDAPDLDEEQTAAQLLGKAYHCARLEPERFESSYCRTPAKSDFPGQKIITSDTSVKAALKEMGCQQTITNESTVERAQRLRDEGHEGPIWALIMDEHERDRAGRIAIEAKYYDQIVQDMDRIRGQGEIAELLSGGAAEVSVFWTDDYGIKCKCRFDLLATAHWADFKTFDNSRGKVLEAALADAVRYNRYYVQAVHYRDGAEAIRTEGLQIRGEATDAQRALIAAIQIRPEELDCWYIFQEKKGIPNLLARQFPFYDVPLAIETSWDTGASAEAQARGHDATRTRTGIAARGEIEIMHAKDQFVLYSNAYDPGTPWFPLSARARFSDLDFNLHWLEGKYQ